MLFAQITDVDPRTLGFADQAAADLGIAPDIAVALQNVAYYTELAGGPVGAVPEPSTAALSLFGLTAVLLAARRRRGAGRDDTAQDDAAGCGACNGLARP
jgi:hypothetical protein